MTDQIIKNKTARIFRAARKLRGLTQVEMSKAIDVAQGTISKFESGQLIPDTGQWYHFCSVLNLDADRTFRSSYIFTNDVSEIFAGHKFKLGKKKPTKMVKVKELIPFISSIKQFNLDTLYDDFLKTNGVDKDVLAVANFNVPIEILDMTINFLMNNNDQPEMKQKVTKNFIDNFELLSFEVGKSSPKILIEKLLKSLNSLGEIFDYQLSNDKVVVEVKDEYRSLKLKDSFFEDFIQYRAQLINDIFKNKFGLNETNILKNTDFNYSIQYA